MEFIVDLIHYSAPLWAQLGEAYTNLTLGRFPYSQFVFTGCNAINASTRVYETNIGKPKLYWLHSFLWVLLNGFGGGFLSPLMIGKPSAPITNDIILPICVTAWYFTHYLGLFDFLTLTPVKVIWSIFLGLFRTHSCCNMVDTSNTVIAAGPYYPTPLIGPIFTGTAVGCFGQFFPLDAGLKPVANGTPWAMQGAFLSSFFYHILVYDKEGFLGNFFRGIFGTHSASTVRVYIATMHLVTLVFQTIFSQDFNLFTPFHNLLYLLFQMNRPSKPQKKSGTVGWAYSTRVVFERGLNILRFIIILSVTSIYIYNSKPPSSLRVGSQMRVGDVIGTCQIFRPVRHCTPFLFTLEEFDLPPSLYHEGEAESDKNYIGLKFVTYAASVETFKIKRQLHWEFVLDGVHLENYRLKWNKLYNSISNSISNSNSNTNSHNQIPTKRSKIAARLGEDGILDVVLLPSKKYNINHEQVLWSSKTNCTKATGVSTSHQSSSLLLSTLQENTVNSCSNNNNNNNSSSSSSDNNCSLSVNNSNTAVQLLQLGVIIDGESGYPFVRCANGALLPLGHDFKK